ncbi:MAG TPA: translocation/assembly module TamB domain-containing protein [Polyangiales bacterium]|nr:translocation/assembly module TamB domain-containing protein [Polyangiales bacterium]
MHVSSKVRKRVLIGFGALLMTPVVLIGLALIALQFRPLRAAALDQVMGLLKGTLQGELQLDDVRWPSLRHVELSGVRLMDRHGELVGNIGLASAHIRLAPLLHGEVHLSEVSVDGVFVDLATLQGDRGLLSVFESKEPKPPEEEKKGSSISVVIDKGCVDGSDVRVQPVPDQKLALHRFAGCIGFSMADEIEIRLDSLRGQLQKSGNSVLAFVDEGELSSAEPGTVLPLAQAFLNGTLKIADPGIGMDGRLEVRGVSKSTLEAAAVKADWLKAAADLSASVRGDVNAMKYQLELRAPDSSLKVSGDFQAEREANAKLTTERFEVGKLTTTALERLAFELGVHVDLTPKQGPRIDADLSSGSLGAWALPVTKVRAELQQDGGVKLPSFEARYPTAYVRGNAQLAGDGALKAAVQAELSALEKLPPVRQMLPGWSGKLSAEASVTRGPNDGPLNVEAHTLLEKLHAESPALAAERVDLKLNAVGQADRPRVNAVLSAEELAIQDQRIAELQLTASGGPDEYQIEGRADGDRGTLNVWVRPFGEALEAGGQLDARLPRGKAKAKLERVRLISGRSLEVEQLLVEHLGTKLTAQGSVGLEGKTSRLDLALNTDNLSPITQEFADSSVPGRVRMNATVTGALDKPAVDLTLDFREGPKLAGGKSQLTLRAKLDAERSQAEIDARAAAGKAVVHAKLESKWRRGAPLSAAADAKHELDLKLERVSIEDLLAQSEVSLPVPLRGSISAELEAHGNLKSLELKTQVDGQMRVGEEPEFTTKLLLEYGGGGLALTTELNDRKGNLLTTTWHQATRLEGFVDKPPKLPEWLGATAWEVKVEVAPRRLSELPSIRTQRAMRELWPLTPELSIQLAHQPDTEPIGDVKFAAKWDPGQVDPAYATCSQKVEPSVELKGKLREGTFVSELTGKADGKQMLRVNTTLGSKLEEWLEGQPLQIVRAKIAAALENFELAQWPVTCEQSAGTLNAKFDATDLFDKKAKFRAQLNAKTLAVNQSLPFDLDVQAQALPSGMDVVTRIERIGGNALIKSSLPISFYVHDPATLVNRDGNLSAEVLLSKVDVKSLLASVPVVARPSGTLDGRLKIFGTLAKPRGSGNIVMNDVSLTLPKLGQRFTKVNGKIAINDNRLQIPEFDLRDQGGSAKFKAELVLDTVESWQVNASAKFRDFPVRKLGVLIGRANADADVKVNATAKQTDVDVRLGEVAVNLSGDTGADVQSLDEHPEIYVDGKPLVQPVKEEPQVGPPTILNVHVHNDGAIWVRRDDFAVRMSTDLSVHVVGKSPQITGEVKLERGYIALLGQEFDIKRGTVTFTGGQEVNPKLELTAQATSPSGKTVRVEVNGFVSAPQLAFFVQDQATTAGEALIALTGRDQPSGGGSEQSAQEQVASAAMGMTTGLLSLGARRAFGDFIPMLSVEQSTESTRVRAGFEADRLIPDFMKGFVKGAYVEGVVSTGDETQRGGDSGGGGAQTGVLLELMLPKDLVWAGKYGPGQTWSIDLDWRP